MNQQPPNPDMIEPKSITSLPAHLRLWLTAVTLLVLDLYSKSWAFQELEPSEVREIIPGFIEFRRSLNTGAVFGALSGYVSLFIVASAAALLFVLYVFAQSPRSQRVLHLSLGLILAGALGNLYDRVYMQADVIKLTASGENEPGIVGRIVSDPTDPVVRVEHFPGGSPLRSFDRAEITVHRQGVVRDFIKFVPVFPSWPSSLAGRDVWPWVFNIADAALVCGVILLLLHSLFDRSGRVTDAETQDDEANTQPAR